MHDPTEGGVAGGIHEMADAAGLGVKIFRDRIRVETEAKKICGFFGIDPIQLIGSGALLVAAETEKAAEIIESLKRTGIQAAIIGEFLPDKTHRTLVSKTGKQEVLPRPASDHLWKALGRT
jgi:hydrogenase maturation factor